MPRLLVFSRTTGYRHDSIAAGRQAVGELAAGAGWAVTATEDPTEFTRAAPEASVILFLNTNGEVLDGPSRAALESHTRSGGGFVGVHSAAATEDDWPLYGDLVGARFDRHPAVQPARVLVEDPSHPATAHLPQTWPLTDEWYDFRANPRPGVHVLATVDETSYTGGTMGADHPIAWCHDRSFYTALGHTSALYADPLFRAHLLGALRWAVG